MNNKFLLIVYLFLFTGIVAQAQSALVVDSANIDRGYVVKVGEQALMILNCTHQWYQNNFKTVTRQNSDTAVHCQLVQRMPPEMPHLQKDIWEAYKDQGLVLIGVDRDEP